MEGEEEEEEEEGVTAMHLVVIVIARLVESEEGAEGVEGSVVVDLVAAERLVEEGENVTDLVGRGLGLVELELFALVRLYPAKSTEAEMLEVEAEVRGIRRVGGMLVLVRVSD